MFKNNNSEFYNISYRVPFSGVQVAEIEIGGSEMADVARFRRPLSNVAHDFVHFRPIFGTMHVKTSRIVHVRDDHFEGFALIEREMGNGQCWS